MNEREKELLERLYNKYVKNEGDDKDMSKEIVEGLEKVRGAVESLKEREPSKWEKQVENFLNDGIDPRIKAAKEKFLTLNHREQAKFKRDYPELYEKMFPEQKVNIPKPANYDTYKQLVYQNEKDVAKLPYNVRLYAKHHDPEFDNVITVADASLKAKQTTNKGNPLLKKLKDMEKADKEQGME